MTMTTHRQTISSPHLGSMFVSLSCISDPPLWCSKLITRRMYGSVRQWCRTISISPQFLSFVVSMRLVASVSSSHPCAPSPMLWSYLGPYHVHFPRLPCSHRLPCPRRLHALTDLTHWSVDDIPPPSSPIHFRAGLLQVYDHSVQQHSISCVTKATFVRNQPFLCSTRGDTQFRRHFSQSSGHWH